MALLKNLIKGVMGYKEIEFFVNGVTFKNGRRNRQTILREIKYKDGDYANKCDVTFKREEYEGEPAISVWTNSEQVGYVPKDIVAEFNDKWTSDYLIETYEVKGSGKDAPFGLYVKVLFNK